MMPPIVAPTVRFFSGRSESFIQDRDCWRRMTPEDEAHCHSGYDSQTHEPSIGVYILRRPNGLLRMGFTLRLSVNLWEHVVERLASRWHREAAAFSKSMLRNAGRRVHFSRSFAQFEILPEQLESWKAELEAVLSDPASFEPLQRMSAYRANPESCQT